MIGKKRKDFEDGSYIEVQQGVFSIIVSISAKSAENPLETIINSVELSQKDINYLFPNYPIVDGYE